jgi:hypothetical protein
MNRALIGVLATLWLSLSASAQQSMPSKEEISELLNKATEKVAVFEKAVQVAKPYLDQTNPKLASNYSDAASTAHKLIQATLSNGPTAYRLVGILATLDDLNADAANGSVQILAKREERTAQGHKSDAGDIAAVTALTSAGTGVADVSELLMHATLRFVNAEEELLGKLLDAAEKH